MVLPLARAAHSAASASAFGMLKRLNSGAERNHDRCERHRCSLAEQPRDSEPGQCATQERHVSSQRLRAR